LPVMAFDEFTIRESISRSLVPIFVSHLHIALRFCSRQVSRKPVMASEGSTEKPSSSGPNP
jgi:hypothetical protein